MPTFRDRKDARRYKVAQRVALTFLLVLIIPLSILSVIIYGQVQTFLQHQAEDHLRAMAKGFALGVYDRLVVASEELGQRAQSTTEGHSSSMFDLVHLPLEQPIETLPLGHVVLRRVAEGDNDFARLYLLYRTAATESSAGEVLAAELRPSFIWAETEQLPYGSQVCVHDDLGRVLHCGGDTLEVNTESGELEQIHSTWELFLDANFAHPPITVTVSQPAHIALAVLADMQKALPLIALLLLVSMALVTAIQVRRQLVPLDELVSVTRKVASGDLSARSEIGREDEFADLSRSFNQMADLMQRRFAILRTLRTVDRAVADQENVLAVTGTVAKLALEATSAQVVGVAMFSESGREWLTVQHRIYRNPDRLHETLVSFTDSLRAALLRPHNSEGRISKATLQSLITPLPQDAKIALLSRSSETSSVWVIACFEKAEEITDEIRLFIDQLADRLSIADALTRKNRELYEHAHFDDLTGLPNRLLLKDRMERALLNAHAHKEMAAVHFIDLDSFKSINDNLGHTVGDQLLGDIAERLKSKLRATDSVGRFGGDEFVVVQTGLESPQDAAVLADKILAAIREPLQLANRLIHPTASIGVSVYPQDADNVEDLLRFADAAMYQAKRQFDSHCFFRKEMDEQLSIAFEFDLNVERALAENELKLVYHPQVDLETGRIIGVEALLRWQQPDGRLAYPDAFIPMAEQTGRIVEMGDWVIRTALAAIAPLCRDVPGLRLAINVAPAQLRSNNFAQSVLQECHASGFKPSELELEITEGALLRMERDPQKVLTQLRDAGVSVALDDFGSGYSSLSYLRQLPVDVIKIDQLFMDGVSDNQQAQAMVSTIVELGRGFEKTVIAEGIETQEQAMAVRSLGVRYGQGFLFAEPLNLDALIQLFLKSNGKLWSPVPIPVADARH